MLIMIKHFYNRYVKAVITHC